MKQFKITGGKEFKIKNSETSIQSDLNKDEIREKLDQNIEKLVFLQDKLYAQDKWGVLIIIQAMDTAGKDGIIKHVMGGLNPQATQVYSFKQPTSEELDHTWLWKAQKCIPERGNIGIFNRSYYEEVLVVKVHNLINIQKLPKGFSDNIHIWDERYKDISNFEEHLNRNGIKVIKLFLHLSKEEQKQRLIERIDDKEKNWKFSDADLKERDYWDNYMDCYQDMIGNTSTKECPWYIIPADNKKLARLLVSDIIIDTLEELNLEYPILEKSKQDMLQTYKEQLLNEKCPKCDE